MELYIQPTRPQRNPINGRFLPGHTSANKGKKWDEYMGKRAQKRAARGWKNLELYRPHGHPNAGRKKKQVVAVMDNGKWTVFPYIGAAADRLGCRRENIGRCCRANQQRHINRKTGRINTDHKYMGIRFYFEEDSVWTRKIINNHKKQEES